MKMTIPIIIVFLWFLYRASLPKAACDQAELNKYLKNAKKKDKTIIQWSQEEDAAFAKCKTNQQYADSIPSDFDFRQTL